jgi:RNA polymerase sigma-54 factor
MQQQMKLAPRIIQAMEILQLPMLALEERIDAEMETNPVLELKDPGVDEEAPPATEDYAEDRGERDMVVDDDNGHQEDFERLDNFTNEYGQDISDGEDFLPSRRAPEGAGDRKIEAMANTPARTESLNEHLLEQWAFLEIADDIRHVGELIIDHIDDDGYLRTPLEELSTKSNPPTDLALLRGALTAVQTLDPAGVGARDLKECLLLQLAVEAARGEDVSLEKQLVSAHLRDVEMNRLPAIAQRTHRSIDEIKTALENLSHLTPRPGSLVGGESAPIITPDAIVDLDDDGNVVITMSDGNTPRLNISRAYRRMVREKSTDGETRKFIQQHVRSAQWLIGAIQQRRDTIRGVVEEVFKVQKDFLLQGREALKPLPMADVAGIVGVHVATVSRAVAGKYVQTPRGIFPLRMFFSGGTTNAEGQDVAWDAVKVKLREIVDGEDKSKPLNDDELAAALQVGGLKIARRTVAKYRGLLDIPPARKRKQF